MVFYNSLMFVILCTQTFSVDCRPLELILQTIARHVGAVWSYAKTCRQSSSRQEPRAWPGLHTDQQTQSCLSSAQERISINVTLANAKY